MAGIARGRAQGRVLAAAVVGFALLQCFLWVPVSPLALGSNFVGLGHITSPHPTPPPQTTSLLNNHECNPTQPLPLQEAVHCEVAPGNEEFQSAIRRCVRSAAGRVQACVWHRYRRGGAGAAAPQDVCDLPMRPCPLTPTPNMQF